MNDYMTFAAIMLQLTGLTAIGVWAVSEIRSTTAALRATIDHLELTVGRLSLTIDGMQEKSTDHEARLRVLESQSNRA